MPKSKQVGKLNSQQENEVRDLKEKNISKKDTKKPPISRKAVFYFIP